MPHWMESDWGYFHDANSNTEIDLKAVVLNLRVTTPSVNLYLQIYFHYNL